MNYVISTRALFNTRGRMAFHAGDGRFEDSDEDGNWSAFTRCGLRYTRQVVDAEGKYLRTDIDWPFVTLEIAEFIGRPCGRCFPGELS